MKFSARLLVLLVLCAAPLAADSFNFDNLRESRWQPEPLFTTGDDGYIPPRRRHGFSLGLWANPSFTRIAVEPTALLFGFGAEGAYNFNQRTALRITGAGFAGTYWYEPEEDEEDDFVSAGVFGYSVTVAFRWKFWLWKHGGMYLDAGLSYAFFDGARDARATHSVGSEFILGYEIGAGRVRGFIESGFTTLVGLSSNTGAWLRTPETDRPAGTHLILARGGIRIYF